MPIAGRSALLNSFLTMALLIAPICTSFASSISCKALLTGDIKPEFKHSTSYTVQLPHTAYIKDQCKLGTCHFQSLTTQLEMGFQNKHGRKIELSADYLTTKYWLEQSIRALDIRNLQNPEISVQLSATVFGSIGAIKRFGLLPASEWKAGLLFKNNQSVTKMSSYINNIIAHSRWRAKNEPDNKKREFILNAGVAQIKKLFSDLLGPEHHTFMFEGSQYNPTTFAQAYFPDVKKPFVQLAVNKAGLSVEESGLYTEDQLFITSLETVSQTAKDLIDQGQSVYLSYDHEPAFVDPKTGIMSVDAFFVPDWAKPLSAEQKKHFEISNRGHAVQIVGYELEPGTKKVHKWKIQNSWGEIAGDRGYFHMYSDYFENFALSISFQKNSNVKLPKTNFKVSPTQNLEF